MLEKLKKHKKAVFLAILLVIAVISSFFVNHLDNDFVVANNPKIAIADTCEVINGSSWCCSNISVPISNAKDVETEYCVTNYNNMLCRTATTNYNNLKSFECTKCKTAPAGYSGYVWNGGACTLGSYVGACGDGYDSHNSFSSGNILGYSGGHPITRVEVSGHVAFCIQPDVWYSKCGYYSTSGASVGVTDNIARIVWAFNHSNQSDSAYMAAQSMIWGTEIVGDASEIYRNMPENNSSSKSYSVSLNKHEIVLNLNDTVEVSDNNNTLQNHSSHFSISASDGLSAVKDGNLVSITADNIYPLTKTVKVNVSGSNPEITGTSGSIDYTKYSSSGSQDFVAFASGTLGNINYTYYSGDTITVKIATGSLEVRKIDSFNRPVVEGTKFKLYYANEDGSIYKEFALEDGTNEFTIDNNGYLLINNIPSGGKFADGTPIGKYVVKELSTTSAYKLSSREYVVDISQDTTSTVTIQNENVMHEGGVTVVKHDEWGRAIEGGTTFRLYYATTDCEGISETGTLNGTTYCKKEVFVNLADKKAGKTESVYTIEDNGTLLISGQLPIGGQFADHTPIGTYILQELAPSNAYRLNSDLYVFEASDPAEEVVIDVEDENAKGNLKINKLDEWNRTTTADIKFILSYAYQNENGEWVDYEDFISAEDYKAGKTKATVFTTAEDGILEINDILPVGGTFPNTDIEIGNYILHEISTTNAYVLNEEGLFVSLIKDRTVEKDFLNDTRTVSFEVNKQDEEENYRKLNEAEFTVYDISDVIDLKMNFDSEDECIAHSGVWNNEENSCLYKTDTITYTKVGSSIDLETILNTIYPGASEELDGKPIKYELSQNSLATVTPFGNLTTEKIGNLTVKVLGGAYELYVSDGDATVYDDENFNPYDLEFYIYKDGVYYQMDTTSVEITNEEMPDFSVIGNYELAYKVVSSKNVVYEFIRKIKVVKDDRHLCLDSGFVDEEGNKIYRYLDTKKVCTVDEAVEIIPTHKTKIVKVALQETSLSEEELKEWTDKELYSLEFKIVQDDDSLISETTEIKELLPIFKGKTGHKYFQLVDLDNHNLYINKEEMLLYSDEELTTPVLKYACESVYGVYDLDKSCWEKYLTGETEEELENSDVESSTEENLDEGAVESFTEQELEDDAVETPTQENINYYYENSRGEAVQVSLYENLDEEYKGKLIIPKLKHSRTYLLSESELPEGYDFSENTNSAYIFNTYDYLEGEIKHSTTLNNILRRLDMVLTKTNEDKSTRLSGALFDVYETFEEGEDKNVIDHSKNDLDLASLEDGREYYKEALGRVSEDGTCSIYELLPEISDTVAIDNEGNIIDSTNATYTLASGTYNSDMVLYKLVRNKYYEVDIDSLEIDEETDLDTYNQEHIGKELYVKVPFEGTCYKIYNPNTVTKKYLGRYLTGGIYEAYVYDEEGNIKLLNNTSGSEIKTYDSTLVGEIEIAIDKNFDNIIKTVKLKNGILETTLNDGTYYTRLKQPTRLVESETEIEDETETVEQEEELIPYEELDPQYQVVNKYYVSKGKFTLENIKYSHNLLYVEVKAPSGYSISSKETAVIPNAPYGVDYMENIITNKIIPTNTKTGVNTYRMWENDRACVAR